MHEYVMKFDSSREVPLRSFQNEDWITGTAPLEMPACVKEGCQKYSSSRKAGDNDGVFI